MNREFAPPARRRKERRRIWRCAVMVLSLCVAGATAYALMRPASTKAKVLICFRSEHEHSASCYAAPTFSCTYQPHIHTEVCYDPESGELLCGQSDFVLHEHNRDCFDADGSLICSLPEKKEHTHTDECRTEGNEPTCGLIECEAHEHTESCYTEQSLLVCENAEEDHEHDESCYQPQYILTCTLPVSKVHTHTEDCYGEPAYILTCDKEELHLHEHTAACYDAETGARICGETELLSHQHTDCWLRPVEPVCGAEEHTHTDGCYEVLPDYELSEPLYCGLGAHQHTADCYDGAGALLCSIPEHVHGEACYIPVQPAEPDAAEEEQPELLGEIELPETLEQLDTVWANTPEELHPALLTAWLAADGESFETLLAQYEAGTAEELFRLLRGAYNDSVISMFDDETATNVGIAHRFDFKHIAGVGASAYRATGSFSTGNATITITADTTENWYQPDQFTGYYLIVKELPAEPIQENHGQVTIDHGFMFTVYDSAGNAKPFGFCGTLNITIASDHALTSSSDGDIYYHDAATGNLKAYQSWENVTLSADKKSVTATSFDCAKDILIDHWEPLDVTFGDYPGIAYLLRNYNVFVSGNYTGTHVVGSIVVGGTLTMGGGIGGISNPHATIKEYPHPVPDYIHVYVPKEASNRTIVVQNDNPKMPVYFGKNVKDQNFTISVQKHGATLAHNNYYFIEDETQPYIDFTPFFASVIEEADAFVADSNVETPSITSENRLISLDAGHVYRIPSDTKWGTSDADDNVKLSGDAVQADTIIVLDGTGTITLPTFVNADGGTFSTDQVEWGEGTGIVFYCPNATEVIGKNITGHIIAPNAKVTPTGGHFNGCVIARELYTVSAEGHMFPYRGRFLVGKTGFTATKYLDGAECPSDKTFSFVLEYWHDTDNEADGYQKGAWQPLETVQNSGSEIIFSQRTYSKDEMDDKTTRDFIYRICEVAPDDPGGILYDSTIYYVKVTATLNGSSITVSDPKYYTTMDETTGALSDLITTETPVFHNRTAYELPETGGPALWLTLAGALLVSLSAFCLIPRRRKERA